MAVRQNGLRIRELRISKGVKKPAFAELVGLSYQHLDNVEHERRNAAPETLARIATVLGVSVAEISTTELLPQFDDGVLDLDELCRQLGALKVRLSRPHLQGLDGVGVREQHLQDGIQKLVQESLHELFAGLRDKFDHHFRRIAPNVLEFLDASDPIELGVLSQVEHQSLEVVSALAGCLLTVVSHEGPPSSVCETSEGTARRDIATPSAPYSPDAQAGA